MRILSKKKKTLEESHKNNIKIDKTKSLVSVSNKSKELPSTVEKIQKLHQVKRLVSSVKL